jgi:hypothetical protein
LDSKRLLSMNVFLRTIKESIDDFMALIQNGNHKEIGQDTLIGLKNNLPDEIEVTLIKYLPNQTYFLPSTSR